MAIKIPLITEFDGGGIDKAVRQFKQLETAGEKAQFAIKKAAIPAAAALGGLAIAGFDAAKAAIEDQKAAQELARTLKASTGATTAQVDATEDFISKLTLASGIADDKLRPALANLARNSQDLTRAQDLLTIAMDISAATGKDLESVSVALGKAETGQYTALKKLGIPLGDNTLMLAELTKEQKKLATATLEVDNLTTILSTTTGDNTKESEALAKAQEKLAKQQQIVADMTASVGDYTTDLNKIFKGASADAAQTAEGRFQRLSVSIAETKESIGAALLPIVEKMLPYLEKLSTFVSENTTLVVALAAAFGTIAAGIIAANVAMKAWTVATTVATGAQTAFNAVMAANPVVLATAAIVALGAAIVVAYKKFEPFRDIVDAVGNSIAAAFTGAVEAVKTAVDVYLGIYKTLFNAIATAWNSTVGKLKFEIPDWVPLLGGKGFSVPNIPKLADGGVVTSPTLALIGEAGPEAVIPLDRMGSGATNVVINVNGGDPNAVVEALRRYMRTNGSIPIKIGNAY